MFCVVLSKVKLNCLRLVSNGSNYVKERWGLHLMK